MSTRALLIGAAAAVVLAPTTLILGVGVIAGGAAGSGGSAAAAAAAVVCTYAYPDAERIADTMTRLTADPVQPAQWDRYASLIGVDPTNVPWEQSSPEQRAQLLRAAVQNLLYTNTPAAVTTPPLIWWHGIVPDDTDTTWETEPVPGWNGTLGDYLAALANDYATNPDNNWDDHQCIPPAATACGQPAEVSAILATIRHMESGDNYLNQSYAVASRGRDSSGNATGAYAFIYTAWGGYGGYDEAFLAPPAVQDQRATDGVTAILDDFGGDPAWVPDRLVRRDRRRPQGPRRHLVTRPDPQPGVQPHLDRRLPSPLARLLHDHRAARRRRQRPAECPQGGQAAVAWGETQIGAPYAAASRYRFGDVPWPGGTLTGDRGDRYTFPAGTIVYDCSGFVIAAWRAAGVDLVAQYGLYGSQAFPHSPLEEIDPAAVMPGDLAVYSAVSQRRRPHRHDPRHRPRRHRPHHRSHTQQRRPHRHHRLVPRHQHQATRQPRRRRCARTAVAMWGTVSLTVGSALLVSRSRPPGIGRRR